MNIAAALLLISFGVGSQTQARVGETYRITRTSDSVDRSSDQTSSGSSHDKDSIVERVVALRDGGVEREYDLPSSATSQERASSWQFPVRVFIPTGGEAQLLDRDKLEARIDSWLKSYKMTRAACGHWIFTWNAFRIECDPRSVLAMLEPFDLSRVEVREGALYRDRRAREAALLKQKKPGTFVALLTINPEIVRREQAEADMVVGEIMRKPIKIDDALRAHASDKILGSMEVTFESDSTSLVRRRTTVTKLTTTKAGGPTTQRITTETLERQAISPAGT